MRTSPSAFEVSVFHLRLSLPSLNDPLAIVLRKAASRCDRVPRVPTRATAARMTSSWSRHEAPTPRRQTSLASMSGHPCFASLARLPDRSTPCRPASAEASNRAVGPASNPFPSGLLPSGLGMAKPTIPQARDRAEVLWGRYTPGMGHERRFPGTSANGRPKRARECLLKVMSADRALACRTSGTGRFQPLGCQ